MRYLTMCGQFDNSAPPKIGLIGKTFIHADGRVITIALFVFIGLLASAEATDWNDPALQLAKKIVSLTGPGAIAVTIENRSSLTGKAFDEVSGRLRANLELLGARSAMPEQAAASVVITLSENSRFYVWVAKIKQGMPESTVTMISFPRHDEANFGLDSLPMSLRKVPLWAQEDRILDVAVLEEDNAPRQIAVLDARKVAIYRLKNGKWQLEQNHAILHTPPWPRDLRGRVLTAKDHLLEVYLPGVFCRSTTTMPLALNCRESDDPWPLLAGPIPPIGGFYSSSRNFFTGALAPGVGKLTAVDKFYSAAALPRENYALWLFAGADGQTHFVDGVTDQVAKLNWGSDIASVKTTCGAGSQVLATSAHGGEAETDSVRAYEVADRDPLPVSAPLTFSGEVTALWSDGKGDTAIAIDKNRETGEYEAFRLAVACSQ
jgi:hypothetical protein